MLKIISENLVFFEDGKPFEGKFGSDGLSPATETIEATVQNILYLILNVSCSFKDVISKALNDNSSQHAFKKIKRVYGQNDPVIAEYCYKLLKLQFDNMSKKKKTANMNLQIVSDNFLSSAHKSGAHSTISSQTGRSSFGLNNSITSNQSHISS